MTQTIEDNILDRVLIKIGRIKAREDLKNNKSDQTLLLNKLYGQITDLYTQHKADLKRYEGIYASKGNIGGYNFYLVEEQIANLKRGIEKDKESLKVLATELKIKDLVFDDTDEEKEKKAIEDEKEKILTELFMKESNQKPIYANGQYNKTYLKWKEDYLKAHEV